MKLKYILYAGLAVLLIYLVYRRINIDVENEKKQSNFIRKSANIEGYVVRPENFSNTLHLTGALAANEEVSLHPETSGIITGIYFKEGSTVTKGSLLMKINDDELQAQLAKALTMEALSADKENRARLLYEKEAISQEEYLSQRADFQALKAETQLIQSQIAKTEIRAPFSGKTGLRAISVGEYVTPQTVITTVSNNNPIKLVFSVPEKYASLSAENPEVTFSVEGNPTTYKARVYAAATSIDPSTRTIQLKATAENNKGELYPGAFTKIDLNLKTVKNALFIPTQAVIPVLKGKKVLICKNGKVQDAMVELGIRTSDKVQVVSGLSAGDTVITTGIMSLKPNTPVQVQITN